jgi:YD repeat-containing protein
VQTVGPGGVTTVTSYESGERRLSFDPVRVTTSGGSLSMSTTYGYAAGSSLPVSITRTGPGGAALTTSIERDEFGNPVSITSPDGRTVTQVFDELGRAVQRTVSTGATTAIAYDDVVHGTGETAGVTVNSGAGTSETSIVRDDLGHAIETTVAAAGEPARTTVTDVNVLGWTLQSARGATGTRTSYDAAGRIAEIVSGTANQGGFTPRVVTTPTYSSSGMIATIVRSEGGMSETTAMSYDDGGRLASSASAGLTTSYNYDSAGRVTARTDGWGGSGGLTTAYAYDASGRLVSTTSPGGKTTTYGYDELGRQVSRTGPDGLTEKLTLDVDGSVLERKALDDQSRVWSWSSYSYDTAGRQVSRRVHRFPVTPEPDLAKDEVLGVQTAYYDSGAERGLVHTITDAMGRQTVFQYDDAGREVERDLPDGTAITTAYNGDGKVASRTVAGPSGAWQETTSYTYDDNGRVATVTDPSGRVTSTFYDELGRKTAELSDDSDIDPQTGEETPVSRLTTWSYGDLGRTVRKTRPDGARIAREYDERGNLLTYTDDAGNVTTYSYDGEGRLASITYPDGTTKGFTYLPDGELDTLTRADGTKVSFAYDGAGRMTGVSAGGQGESSYAYDAAGHLLSASNPHAALAFAWDSVGNQLSESLQLKDAAFAGLGAKELVRSYDMANRPVTLGYPDGLGDLQRRYDAGDRLDSLAIDGDTLWQASYDGSRLVSIARGNGLATDMSYTAGGEPRAVVTGVPATDGTIPDPLHRLDLAWTVGHLRPEIVDVGQVKPGGGVRARPEA